LGGGFFPRPALGGGVWLNGASLTQPAEIDSMGWYNGAQTYSAPPMNGANALFRALGGCVDDDVSLFDFDLAAPAPRNSSVTHVCPFVGPDCNRNGIDDRDEIIDDPTLDCDGNGRLDSCGYYVGPFPDCDHNGAPDCVAILNGAPDANGNRQVDTCEGAAIFVAPATVTVVASGVSSDITSWRAAGAQSASGPAFAVARWDNAALRQIYGSGYG